MGFFDGGTKGASFDEAQGYVMGTVWSGVVTNVREEVPLTEYTANGAPGPVKTTKAGKVIMQLPVEFQTDQVPPGEGDDGIRVIYFEGEKKQAMIRAMRAAGIRRDLMPGDWIALKWVGLGGETGRRKLYEAQIRPGNGQVGSFFAEQPAQPVAPAPVPAAPQAPQPQAAQVAAQLQQAPQVAPAQPAPAAAPQGEARPPWQAQPQPAAAGQGVW